MKIKKICKDLYHISFPSQYAVTSTFMRLQEYYESPYKEIKGRHVSVEFLMDTYAKYNDDEFTYFSDWSGFNVPDTAVKEFFKWINAPEVFDYMDKELELYNLIKKTVKDYDEKFYIIATYDVSDIAHEVAHGLYYLDENYKNEMDEIVDSYKEKHILKETLCGMGGYCEDVLNDEIQAYVSTSDPLALRNHFPSIGKRRPPKNFKLTLNKYLKKYKIKL